MMTRQFRNVFNIVFRLIAVLAFLGLAVLPVFGQSETPAPALDLTSLAAQFAALAGAGALISALVNAGKAAGLVKDGQAPTIVTAFNILGVAGLLALRVFQPGADLAGMDATAGGIATALIAITGLVVQLGGSKLFHTLAKSTPVIGKSFSAGK